VEQTIAWTGATPKVIPPKTKGSRRTVPLTSATTALLRDYIKQQPRRDDPTSPLFPGVRLLAPKPTGVRATDADGGTANEGGGNAALRQATALAELTRAEAAARLVLDWTQPYRLATFYKAVYRPAVLRANRAATASGDKAAALPPRLRSTRSGTPTRACASRRDGHR
jgi:integrase